MSHILKFMNMYEVDLCGHNFVVNPSLHISLQFCAVKSSLHKKQIHCGRFQRAHLTKRGDMISD